MNFEEFRSLFPQLSEITYLATPERGLMADPILEAAQSAVQGWRDFNPEAVNRVLLKQTAERIADLLKVDKNNVACTTSTSHGFMAIANSFPWQEGDNLVLCGAEHPNNFYPWVQLKNRGVEIRVTPANNGSIDIEELINAVDEKTRILALSLVSFYPGVYSDIEKLQAALTDRDIFIVLDIIQALGFLPVYPEELGVDAVAGGAYKGLMNPHGGGILYVSDRLLDLLLPRDVNMSNVAVRSTDPVYDYSLITSAAKLQPLSMNLGQLAGINKALELILELGIDNIGLYLHSLAQSTVEGLRSIGVNTFLEPDSPYLRHIVCFDEPRAQELVEFAEQRGVIFNARRTGIRIGFHAYNNMDDVDRLLEVVGEFYKQK